MSHPLIFLYSDKISINILFLYSVINQQSENLSINLKNRNLIFMLRTEISFQKSKILKIIFNPIYLSINIINKKMGFLSHSKIKPMFINISPTFNIKRPPFKATLFMLIFTNNKTIINIAFDISLN